MYQARHKGKAQLIHLDMSRSSVVAKVGAEKQVLWGSQWKNASSSYEATLCTQWNLNASKDIDLNINL